MGCTGSKQALEVGGENSKGTHKEVKESNPTVEKQGVSSQQVVGEVRSKKRS